MKTSQRRRLVFGSATAVSLLTVAGGSFYFTGGYETWRDGGSLNEACGGVVPRGEVRTALGSDNVRAESETMRYFPRSEEGPITNCYAEAPDNGKTITVDLHWSSEAERIASAIKHEFLTTVGGAAPPHGARVAGRRCRMKACTAVWSSDAATRRAGVCSSAPSHSMISSTPSTRTKAVGPSPG